MTGTRRERTDRFIKKYLAEGEPSKGMTFYGMRADSRGTDQKRVASNIWRMDYQKFMRTNYWRLTAWQVKHDSGWRRSITGRRGNLEVHHMNYLTHGFEMFHLGELKCVCRKEHVKIHREMAAAIERKRAGILVQ